MHPHGNPNSLQREVFQDEGNHQNRQVSCGNQCMRILHERIYRAFPDLHKVMFLSLEPLWSNSRHHDNPHKPRPAKNMDMKKAVEE